MNANLKHPPPAKVTVGNTVEFDGPQIRPRTVRGKAIAVKWSRKSGWWVDIQPEDGGGCWRMSERLVRVVPDV